MIDEASVPSGDETAAESVENTEETDDNLSIRALLETELEKSEDPSPPAETQSESSEAAPEDGAETPTVEDAPPAPPVSWTESEREAWQELPESVQHAVSRREKEFQAGLKSDAELQKVVAPIAEQLEGTGMHVDQYVDTLIKADRYIDQNPLDAVLNIVQKHGLQDQLAQRLNPSDNTPTQSRDEVAQLRAEMQYKDEVNRHANEWSQIQAKHPDAVELQEVIIGQLTANPNWSIQQGYEAAKNLVDGLTKGQRAAAEASDINAKTTAAQKANRLNLPKGKTGNVAPPASTGNLRDDIREAARQTGVKLD